MDDDSIGEGTRPEAAAEAAAEAVAPSPPPPAPVAAGSPAPRRRWLGWGAAILAVVIAGTGFFFLGHWMGSDSEEDAQAAASVTTTIPALTWTGETLAPGDEPVADVAAALSPSVVQIETDYRSGLRCHLPLRRLHHHRRPRGERGRTGHGAPGRRHRPGR